MNIFTTSCIGRKIFFNFNSRCISWQRRECLTVLLTIVRAKTKFHSSWFFCFYLLWRIVQDTLYLNTNRKIMSKSRMYILIGISRVFRSSYKSCSCVDIWDQSSVWQWKTKHIWKVQIFFCCLFFLNID
jgi:hypothetical protein